MADADTSSVEPDPEELTRRIEHTRDELARTIDAIADRVSPANAARRAMARARAETPRVDPRVVAAGAVLILGVTAFMVWRRRRR